METDFIIYYSKVSVGNKNLLSLPTSASFRDLNIATLLIPRQTVSDKETGPL